jgi:hypothetical protein
MAQKKRSYGSGSVTKRGKGLAIRWREKEITPDGRTRIVQRCKALGEVTKTEANEKLREELAKSAVPKAAAVTFADFAASWKALVLPNYPEAFDAHASRGHSREETRALLWSYAFN